MNDKSIVGEQAKKVLFSNEDAEAHSNFGKKNPFCFFKRSMGLNESYDIFDKKINPTILSSLVLKQLYEDAKSKFGEISEAVVTVPANFTNQAREATFKSK